MPIRAFVVIEVCCLEASCSVACVTLLVMARVGVLRLIAFVSYLYSLFLSDYITFVVTVAHSTTPHTIPKPT